MDKLTMAHDYAVAMLKTPAQLTGLSDKDIAIAAFNLADAMQAEADKRNNKETCDKNIGLDSSVLKPSNSMELEWQPDWSQAPDNATHWAMDGCGQCNWYEREPEVCGSKWDCGGVIEQVDTGYDYQGNWQDSLRKRPQ